LEVSRLSLFLRGRRRPPSRGLSTGGRGGRKHSSAAKKGRVAVSPVCARARPVPNSTTIGFLRRAARKKWRPRRMEFARRGGGLREERVKRLPHPPRREPLAWAASAASPYASARAALHDAGVVVRETPPLLSVVRAPLLLVRQVGVEAPFFSPRLRLPAVRHCSATSRSPPPPPPPSPPRGWRIHTSKTLFFFWPSNGRRKRARFLLRNEFRPLE